MPRLLSFFLFLLLWIAIAVVTRCISTLFEGDAGVSTTPLDPAANPPDDFRVLMFSSQPGIMLHDAPDGQPLHPLKRALVNTCEEVRAGGWVRVLTETDPLWVRLDDLAYLPHDGTPAPYVQRWHDVFTSPALGYPLASASMNPLPQRDWYRCAIRITPPPIAIDPEYKRDWREFIYETDGVAVRPTAVRVYSSLHAAFTTAVTLFLSFALATCVTGGVIVRRRVLAKRKTLWSQQPRRA